MKKLFLTLSVISLIFTYSCKESSGIDVTTEENQIAEIVTDIDAKQFKELINNQEGTILDVRTPEEWAEGTIPNATKMNYYEDNFPSMVEKLDKNKPVFVYCKRGGRSSSAAEILEEKGFKKIYNLDGGITAWSDEGYETSK